MQCYFCKNYLAVTDRIGRQESCSHCGNDLHICKNCDFYDVTAYNECRESQADRVVDKEKANFCDYFTPGRGMACHARTNSVTDAKKKLEQLFKK